MLKNAKRFVETFKNYTSYIHTCSLTENFENSRKTASKAKFFSLFFSSLPPENIRKLKVFRGCSIKKMFLKILQNSQENTCARQKQPFRIPMPKCDFNRVALLLYWNHFGMGVFLWTCCIFSEHLWVTASGKGLFFNPNRPGEGGPSRPTVNFRCLYPKNEKRWGTQT